MLLSVLSTPEHSREAAAHEIFPSQILNLLLFDHKPSEGRNNV
jgi:hypothetical protein